MYSQTGPAKIIIFTFRLLYSLLACGDDNTLYCEREFQKEFNCYNCYIVLSISARNTDSK